MFKFLKKEITKPFEVPEYIILNVDNFNLWFNKPKDENLYAHSGIFLRLDKLSVSHVLNYITLCYGIPTKEASTNYNLYSFYDEIKVNWVKLINDKKNNIPKGWIVYESGQSPAHLLWFVNLVNIDDLCNNVQNPRYSFVEEMDSFESALEEAIKGCK